MINKLTSSKLVFFAKERNERTTPMTIAKGDVNKKKDGFYSCCCKEDAHFYDMECGDGYRSSSGDIEVDLSELSSTDMG